MEASRTHDAPVVTPAEAWWRNSFMVTFSFTCNLGCSFCMVEDILDVFPGTSVEEFQRFADNPERLAGVKRIIFSGGKVTLDRRLAEYVKIARSLPQIEHVRIQTNAVRLGRADWLRAIMDAGVDEFFISIHGHNEEVCDALTRRKGSFRAIMAGIESVAASGATWITNTAIVDGNWQHLERIVELVGPYKPRSMEFWNYWPRGDERGERGATVPVGQMVPVLKNALRSCIERGIPPVVKWVPRCLLGEYSWCQDDGQPAALIEDRYWDREPSYACIYEGVCLDRAPVCSGLSYPYIERFGWEHNLLVPRRAGAVGTERGPVERSLTQDPAPQRGDSAVLAAWLAQFGIETRDAIAGYRLQSCTRTSDRREVRVRFAGDGRVIDVFVRARDLSRPCSVRTPSFDLLTSRPPKGREEEVKAVLREIARRIAARDSGDMTLPA